MLLYNLPTDIWSQLLWLLDFSDHEALFATCAAVQHIYLSTSAAKQICIQTSFTDKWIPRFLFQLPHLSAAIVHIYGSRWHLKVPYGFDHPLQFMPSLRSLFLTGSGAVSSIVSSSRFEGRDLVPNTFNLGKALPQLELFSVQLMNDPSLCMSVVTQLPPSLTSLSFHNLNESRAREKCPTLSHLPLLTHLEISNCEEFEDPDFDLSGLKHLQSIHLWQWKRPVALLPSLQSLSLPGALLSGYSSSAFMWQTRTWLPLSSAETSPPDFNANASKYASLKELTSLTLTAPLFVPNFHSPLLTKIVIKYPAGLNINLRFPSLKSLIKCLPHTVTHFETQCTVNVGAQGLEQLFFTDLGLLPRLLKTLILNRAWVLSFPTPDEALDSYLASFASNQASLSPSSSSASTAQSFSSSLTSYIPLLPPTLEYFSIYYTSLALPVKYLCFLPPTIRRINFAISTMISPRDDVVHAGVNADSSSNEGLSKDLILDFSKLIPLVTELSLINPEFFRLYYPTILATHFVFPPHLVSLDVKYSSFSHWHVGCPVTTQNSIFERLSKSMPPTLTKLSFVQAEVPDAFGPLPESLKDVHLTFAPKIPGLLSFRGVMEPVNYVSDNFLASLKRLPRSLLSFRLDMQVLVPSSQDLIESLPRSMKFLVIKSLLNLNISQVHLLPPSLRSLEVHHAYQITDQCLPKLPGKLETLSLKGNRALTPDCFTIWPRQLNYLHIPKNSNFPKRLRHCEEIKTIPANTSIVTRRLRYSR